MTAPSTVENVGPPTPIQSAQAEPDPKEVIASRLEVSGEMLRLVAKRFAETGGDVLATKPSANSFVPCGGSR